MTRGGKTQANLDLFTSWLDGLTFTRPVTLEDKAELKRLVKEAMVGCTNVRVDVYAHRDPDEIYLRIECKDTPLITRTFRAV